MRKILIIGATSAIAEHCARLWAKGGDALYLVGRDKERLSRTVADLKIRGASKVGFYCMDLNDIEGHEAMLSEAAAELEGLDVALIAHGSLSDQKRCEQDVALTLREIGTNALSVVALLTLLANRFEAKRKGTIVVISSVAGDRGRQSNYVYGSSKAMVTAFASGLRQRLHKSGVAVLTVKPAFVDSPMTRGFDKGFLWTKPETVAGAITRSIASGSDEIYTPAFWRLMMFVVRAIPTKLFKRIRL